MSLWRTETPDHLWRPNPYITVSLNGLPVTLETLFDIPVPKRRLSIDERFAIFDAEHPEVYAAFKHIAVLLLKRGHQRYSADGCMHIVRFRFDVNHQRDEGYRINNDLVSRYARKLAAEDERFADFFEMRKLKGRQG